MWKRTQCNVENEHNNIYDLDKTDQRITNGYLQMGQNGSITSIAMISCNAITWALGWFHTVPL
jgi:hypothetical protein